MPFVCPLSQLGNCSNRQDPRTRSSAALFLRFRPTTKRHVVCTSRQCSAAGVEPVKQRRHPEGAGGRPVYPWSVGLKIQNQTADTQLYRKINIDIKNESVPRFRTPVRTTKRGSGEVRTVRFASRHYYPPSLPLFPVKKSNLGLAARFAFNLFNGRFA